MQKRKEYLKSLLFVPLILFGVILAPAASAYASSLSVPTTNMALSQCGSGSEKVVTAINFGCTGAHCYPTSDGNGYCSGDHSALVDMLFAVVRFLTDGVGLIIIMSLIIAGIQYTTSQGDPSGIKHATERIRSAVTALILFIFAYAILNYVIPSGFFG